MTSQVVQTKKQSNSSSQDYSHPDEHNLSTKYDSSKPIWLMSLKCQPENSFHSVSAGLVASS